MTLCSDKGQLTRKLVFSKSNYFTVWRHPLKVLKLHSYRAKVQWAYNKERIYYLKGLKLLAPRPLLIFFYIPTILINILPRTQYRGCGNLGASIGSTMKSTSSILTISNSPYHLNILSFPCLSWLGGCKQSYAQLQELG